METVFSGIQCPKYRVWHLSPESFIFLEIVIHVVLSIWSNICSPEKKFSIGIRTDTLLYFGDFQGYYSVQDGKFIEGGIVHQPKIHYGSKNLPNIFNNYEDCEDRAYYGTEGGILHQPNIYYGAKNLPKIVNNYEDCEDEVDYGTKLIMVLKKIMRKLDMRLGNNVSSNVKANQQHNSKRCNFQHKIKDGERPNLEWI